MSYKDIITRDPSILGGKPIIRGTRISVELILKKMSEGAATDDILKAYPHLKADEIYAALEYAEKVISNEETFNL